MLVLFIALLPAIVAAQKIEKTVVNDMKSLGFDLEQGEGYYMCTESGGMYDSPSLPYMLRVVRNGNNELISLAILARIVAPNDTSFIRVMYDALVASTDLHCAGYAITALENGTQALFLQRSIESTCYSPGLVKQVLDCMKKELSTWAGYAQGSGLSSTKRKQELGEEVKDALVRFMKTHPMKSR